MPHERQLKGGRVGFGLQFEGTQCIKVGKAGWQEREAASLPSHRSGSRKRMEVVGTDSLKTYNHPMRPAPQGRHLPGTKCSDTHDYRIHFTTKAQQ